MHPKKQILVLPFPPSVNHYWRHVTKGPLRGRSLISQEGRYYRRHVGQIVALSHAYEVCGPLKVDIEARMPDKRRRDVDNLPKAVLDALTSAGIWNDDSQVVDLRVWKSTRMDGEIVVTIEEINFLPEQLPHVANA